MGPLPGDEQRRRWLKYTRARRAGHADLGWPALGARRGGLGFEIRGVWNEARSASEGASPALAGVSGFLEAALVPGLRGGRALLCQPSGFGASLSAPARSACPLSGA